MNSTMICEARELAGWSAESEALSVYQTLEKLVDKRRAQGKRYSLALVLTCVLLAKMAGETTLQAITEWVRLRGTWFQQLFPETRTQFPCAATSSKVLRSLDPEQVNQLLMDLLTRVRGIHTHERRTNPCGAQWKKRFEERWGMWQKTKRACIR